MLAEMKRQEQEQKKLPEEQKAKDVAQTQHLENKEVTALWCNFFKGSHRRTWIPALACCYYE